MQKRDWLHPSRIKQVEMAKNWNTILAVKGAGWGVPATDMAELKTDTDEAQKLLDIAMSAERTATVTAKCNEAFDRLRAKMRAIKERYFHTPPLTNDDLVSLGLKPKDSVHTPIPRPDIEAQIILSSPGPHILDLHLRSAEGMTGADPRSLDKYQIRWGLMPTGTPPTEAQIDADPRLLAKTPTRPEDLPKVFSTKRKTHQLTFNLDDSGKLFFATACFQNPAGDDGPYCEITRRLIP